MSAAPALLIVGIGSVAGAFLFYWINRLWMQWRIFWRRRHGLRSEAKAGSILRRYGYKLRGTQYNTKMTMLINGRRIRYSIRPDGIAKKRGRWYLVEVKTGKTAVNPLYRETRRQLLEYYHSLPVDGVLLVDADKQTVQNIRFRGKNIRAKTSKLYVLLAFIAGIALTLALL